MDLTDSKSVFIKEYLAKYHFETYRNTTAGFVDVFQTRCIVKLTRMLEKGDVVTRKRVVRFLTECVNRCRKNVKSRLDWKVDGTTILPSWDGHSLSDPSFLIAADVLRRSVNLSQSPLKTLEEVRDFLNDARNAVTASDDNFEPLKMERALALWQFLVKDLVMVLKINDSRVTPRVKKITKEKGTEPLHSETSLTDVNLTDLVLDNSDQEVLDNINKEQLLLDK